MIIEVAIRHCAGRRVFSKDRSTSVDGRCEIWFDGGVQSGQDMLRALALGAKACLIGKSFLCALAAMSGPGVTLALNLLRKALEVTLALTGCTDICEVDESILRRTRRGAEEISDRRD